MNSIQLLETAEQMLDLYREALLIDGFVKITTEIADGDFISQTIKDSAAFSWKLKLNPARHQDVIDIQYSVVDCLLNVLFEDFSLIESNSAIILEYKKRLVSRLAAAICGMMALSEKEDGEQDEG